jgi:hypothetical protein
MGQRKLSIKELRVGNYVSANDVVSRVYSIDSPEPREEERFNNKPIIAVFNWGLYTLPLDEVSAISLTNDVLLKLGFELEEFDHFNTYSKVIGGLLMTYYSNGFVEVGDLILKHIEYLHQLQNLVYSLTEEELTWKN